MNTDESDLAKAVTTLRIIVGSLVTGVVAFAAVVAYLINAGQVKPAGQELVTYMGFGMLALMTVLQFVILPLVEKGARQQIDDKSAELRPWLGLYQQRTIVGCALLEGAGFMCVLGSMMDGRPYGLAGGLAAAVIMLALHFPTDERVRRFVERQRELTTTV